MKKQMTGILLIVLLLAGSGVIFSYFSQTGTRRSTLYPGAVDITLLRISNQPWELLPGNSHRDEVKVKNDGASACYVRVKTVCSDSDFVDGYRVNYNEKAYIYDVQDGYYYYIKPLNTGEETESLFTEISLSNGESLSQDRRPKILVYAEGCQADGYQDYKDAWNGFLKHAAG